jgi:hypothetical protein
MQQAGPTLKNHKNSQEAAAFGDTLTFVVASIEVGLGTI